MRRVGLNRTYQVAVFLPLLFILFTGCTCIHTAPEKKKQQHLGAFTIDEAKAKEDIAFMASAPHAFGTPRQEQIGDFLKRRAEDGGSAVFTQDFEAQTPNPAVSASEDPGVRALAFAKKGRNLFAVPKNMQNKACVILLGSHYDTKDIPGIDYLGANDSASSSILLLHLAAHIAAWDTESVKALSCAIAFYWFDGEEAVLPGWMDGQYRHPSRIKDNTYGSRYAAKELESCKGRLCRMPANLGAYTVHALILLDMVGNPDLKLSRDTNSDPGLFNLLYSEAERLGYAGLFAENSKGVEDDHIPFQQVGIPSLNVIDFENLYNWHNASDKPEHLSMESLSKVGRLTLAMALTLARNPKVLR